jgi:PEP-CTERM motif
LEGTVLNNGGVLRGAGRLEGDLVVDRGRVQVGAGQLMQLVGMLDNHGSVDVQAHGGVASLQVVGALKNGGDGQMNLLHADLLAQAGLVNGGRLNIAGLTTVTGAVNNGVGARIAVSGSAADAIFWDTVHNDGEVGVTTGSAASFFGRVTGAGSYTGGGAKNFAGGFAPGNSPALVTLQGTVVFDAGTVVMELGGTTAGSGHDKLVFTDGSVTIDGAAVDLQLLWWAGHTGSAGETYDLFDWNGSFSTLAGNFGTIALPALADGLAWDTSRLYTTGEIGISAVPEPGTWLLMVLGLAGLGWRARRDMVREGAGA